MSAASPVMMAVAVETPVAIWSSDPQVHKPAPGAESETRDPDGE